MGLSFILSHILNRYSRTSLNSKCNSNKIMISQKERISDFLVQISLHILFLEYLPCFWYTYAYSSPRIYICQPQAVLPYPNNEKPCLRGKKKLF